MILDTCSWDTPGANRYTGSAVEAISAYKEIPTSERQQLINAINKKDYTDLVIITKNSIKGITDTKYNSDISNMHFGSNGVICKKVTRSNWSNDQYERAMVFSTRHYTVIMPSVCGNFSIITKITEDPRYPPVEPREPREPHEPIKVPEPWSFPLVAAAAAFFTFKRKKNG